MSPTESTKSPFEWCPVTFDFNTGPVFWCPLANKLRRLHKRCQQTVRPLCGLSNSKEDDEDVKIWETVLASGPRKGRKVPQLFLAGDAGPVLSFKKSSYVPHTIHGNGIFTYMKTHRNQPNVGVFFPVPWMVWGRCTDFLQRCCELHISEISECHFQWAAKHLEPCSELGRSHMTWGWGFGKIPLFQGHLG